MNLLAGQKCLIVWVNLVVTSILVSIYLDGGPDSSPLFLALFLFLSDAVCFAAIFYDIYTTGASTNYEFSSFLDVWSFVCPERLYFLVKFSCLTTKTIFQILLFIRLMGFAHIPIFVILIPFWTLLTLILIDLTRRLYLIQKKA